MTLTRPLRSQRTRSFTSTLFVSAALVLGLSLLSGCGGGGGGSDTSSASGGSTSDDSNTDPSGSSKVTSLVITDTALGTGAEATLGKSVSVHYTGWLYNVGAANFKGTQFGTSIGQSPFDFTIGAGDVIGGFERGVTGMKVGGKRTVIIPSTQAYGASGANGIPANAALVFDLELVAVK